MLRVALTGAIGSGKSTAAAMLRGLGAQVSSSDEVARALMQPGERLYAALVQRFGAEIVRADGTLDRTVLARIAFEQGRVEEINAVVHPVVIEAQQRWLAGFDVRSATVAVVETALLFETSFCGEGGAPWRASFDRIVLVTAPVEVRLERYLARTSGLDTVAAAADFRRRDALQLPEEQKLPQVSAVVRNDGARDGLRRELERLWPQLLEASRHAAARCERIEGEERPRER